MVRRDSDVDRLAAVQPQRVPSHFGLISRCYLRMPQRLRRLKL